MITRGLVPAYPLGQRVILPLSDLSQSMFWLTLFAVLVRISVSAPMLNMIGIKWGINDSNIISKLHPGTELLGCIFALWVIESPARAKHYFDQHLSHLGLILMGLMMPVYGAAVGLTGTATFFDTYLAAGLLLPLMHYSTPRQLRTLALWMIAVTVVNAMVCTHETLTETQVFPEDFDGGVIPIPDFRGRAFFDSSLGGSMITQLAIFLTLGVRLNPLLKTIVIAAMMIGLFGYGGRVALVATLAGLVVVGVVMIVQEIVTRGRRFALFGYAVVFAVAMPLLIFYATVATPIGQRIVNNFYQDDSAQIRNNVWDILGNLPFNNVLFGTPDSQLTNYAYQVGIDFRTEDVEICWLLLFLTLGVIGFTFFMLTFVPFLASMWRRANFVARVMLLVFLGICSASNSIGRKSNTLILLIPAVYAMSRLNRRTL